MAELTYAIDDLRYLGIPSPIGTEKDEYEQFHRLEWLSELTQLEILAQPCYTSRLRTREHHLKENRRHALEAKNKNSPFTSPTIRIPSTYINPLEQYYIGIFLVTIPHGKTNCRYFHPYELEDIDYPDRNGKDHGVWYPINTGVVEDIQSFPSIRISKRKEADLEKYHPLRVFYGYNSNLLTGVVSEMTSGRKLVQEYNLKTTQLAFTIGKKINPEDRFPGILDPSMIVYSEAMVDGIASETVDDNESTPVSDLTPPICQIYKYAPRCGSAEGQEEVLIFYTKTLEPRKYGALQVTFQCDVPNFISSVSVVDADIEVKGQMVSFKTPPFPFLICQPMPVNIILQQEKRILKSLEYFYIPKLQCSTCQANATKSFTPIPRNHPNKRSKSSVMINDNEIDAVVPVCANKPVLQQSKSEPESHSSSSTHQLSINTSQTNDADKEVLDRLEESVVSLFTNADFKPLFRICRSFVRKQPHLLHTAVTNNHFALLAKFIPVAQLILLRHKNQLGESLLLHAARLNRLHVVQTLLDKPNSDELLDDVNDKGQNILHVVVMNIDGEEMLDLLIDHCRKRSIDIEEKFDDVDEDDHTPLELSIVNNNQAATRQLLQYSNKTVCKTNDNSGDNLIHLAVRYGDLIMLQCLIGDEQLKKQGTRSNLTMTPKELARSLKRDDMIKYFNEIYPEPEVDENESSDDN